ncbi:MAG: hypothetical protein WBO10_02745 [Pyrinomonadaceae bacterium]
MASPIIPSKSFFPTSLLDRVGWYGNFDAQAQNEGLNYGLVQDDLDQIAEDNAMMQFIGTSFVSLDAYSQAWTAFRNTLMMGTIGEPTPDVPGAPTLVGVPVPPTGIFQRINKYRDIVRASLKYTKEVGEAWGIEPSKSEPHSPTSVKPTIQLFGAANNHHFSIVTSERGEATMWDVYIMRKGANWEKHSTCSGKSADISVTLSSPGDAEQIQVYIQLRKNNADYGQPSDPAYVTLNP